MKLLFAGDVILQGDRLDVSEAVDVNVFDYRFVNFEAPCCRTSEKKAVKAGPSLCQSEAALAAVCDAGFNVAALANNHMMDYGLEAAMHTADLFHSRGVLTCGLGRDREEAMRPVLLEKDGEKIAILNLAEGQFGAIRRDGDSGYAWIMDEMSTGGVHNLVDRGYKVIVFAHAGLEDMQHPLPEWQAVYRRFIDAGAYLVVAAHPHIAQGWETYKGRRIYYSLGNFAFDREILDEKSRKQWHRGLMLVVDTVRDVCDIIPTVYQNGKILREEASDFQDYLAECCRVLESSTELARQADMTAERCWQAFYRDYYLTAFPIGKRDILRFLWQKLRRHKITRPINALMLYHNLLIETHRWVVMRYLTCQKVEELEK